MKIVKVIAKDQGRDWLEWEMEFDIDDPNQMNEFVQFTKLRTLHRNMRNDK